MAAATYTMHFFKNTHHTTLLFLLRLKPLSSKTSNFIRKIDQVNLIVFLKKGEEIILIFFKLTHSQLMKTFIFHSFKTTAKYGKSAISPLAGGKLYFDWCILLRHQCSRSVVRPQFRPYILYLNFEMGAFFTSKDVIIEGFAFWISLKIPLPTGKTNTATLIPIATLPSYHLIHKFMNMLLIIF